MDDRIDLEALLGEFRAEARQQLDHLDQTLVGMEESGALAEEERIGLLRVLHTLKGNSAMLGLQAMAEQVHALENVFKVQGEGAGPSSLDPLFELSAALRSALDRLGTPDQSAALERVAAVRVEGNDEVEGKPISGARESGVRPVAPTASGRTEESVPAEGQAGESEQARVIPADAEIDVGPALDILRVPFTKLDGLLSRVGEVVTLQTRLEAFADAHRETLEAAGAHRQLREQIEDLQSLAGALQDTTMELRLVPLRTVLGRFPALVRDLARRQGKRARVVLSGEDIELDKSAVDALGEPLLHLVRNAVDHGLETPEVRDSAGKDPVGTIEIRGRRDGDHIAIHVLDDGKGLDRAGILRRARQIGIEVGEGEEDAATLQELIFAPGFSTRDEVTTVSGRGMGLDIVRRAVSRLRGTLNIEAGEPNGLDFILRLPLTLAIVPALIFESEGEMLALPASDVEETLGRRAPERVGGAEVVRRGETVVAVARPHRLFAWPVPGSTDGGGQLRFSIIVRRGERTVAIPADRLIDQRNVVVKGLPPILGTPRGLSGATVAADGRVILLLDSQALLDINLESQRRPARVV